MSAIETLQRAIEHHSCVNYQGQPIDVLSAQAVLAVWNGLGEENKRKYEQMMELSLAQAVSIAWKLIK